MASSAHEPFDWGVGVGQVGGAGIWGWTS